MNAEVPPGEKSSLPNGAATKFNVTRWLVVLTIGLVLVAGLLYLNQFRHVALAPSTVSKEYEFPAHSQGAVDYFKVFEAAAISEDIATEKNGFRWVVQNVDLSGQIPKAYFDEFHSKLGLDPSTMNPTLAYVTPSKAIEQYFNSSEYDNDLIQRLDREVHPKSFPTTSLKKSEYVAWDVEEILVKRASLPWTKDELPMMSKWVEANGPALDVYAHALRKELFSIPLVACRNSEAAEFTSFRTFGFCYSFSFRLQKVARGFSIRANYFLGEGKVRQALDDLISCKLLGRHLCNQNNASDRQLGMTCEAYADYIGVCYPDSPISKEDLDYFLAELNSVPDFADLKYLKLYEKCRVATLINKISREPEFFDVSDNASYLVDRGIDWNVAFREYCEMLESLWKPGLEIDELYRINDLIEESWDKDEYPEITTLDTHLRSFRSRKIGQVIGTRFAGFGGKWQSTEDRCIRNLRQITLAMLQYEKEHGRLPPAFTADEKGNPLHSWRVLLLPYLGEKGLYQKIRLNEPWNSAHNLKQANSCPRVFACPICKTCNDGKTSYSVVVGKDLPFEGSNGKKLSDFGPNSNDMILVVERSNPLGWMEPTQEVGYKDASRGIGLLFGSMKPALIGGSHDYVHHVGVRSGAVVLISEYIEPDVFIGMLKGTNREINYH